MKNNSNSPNNKTASKHKEKEEVIDNNNIINQSNKNIIPNLSQINNESSSTKKFSIEFNSLLNISDSNNSNMPIKNFPSPIQKSQLNTNNVNNKINNNLFD